MSDDLGDHRIEFGGHSVSVLDSGVDPDTGAARHPEEVDPTGCRREASIRVLGVDASLHGEAGRLRGVTREQSAVCDIQLEFDHVDTGGHLGDGVFDLESGVDLHEEETLARFVVQELDGPRPDISSGFSEAGSGFLDEGVLSFAQDR